MYLYEKTKQSITTDVNSEYNGIIAGGKINGYKLYDCKDGICKPTMGIIEVYGGDVYVMSTSNGKIADELIDKSVKEDIDCTEDNIGKIFSDKSGICYMYGAGLKYGEKSGVHMIMEGTAVVDTLFGVTINEKDGYPVKSEGDFIVFDQFTDEGKRSENELKF